MKRRTDWFLLAFLAFGLCRSSLAHASVAEVYGLGSRAIGLGGAFTAVADDFSAVYYNPAGLTAHHKAGYFRNNKGLHVEVGFLYAEPKLRVRRLDGRPLDLHHPDYDEFPGGVSSPERVSGVNLGFVFEPFDMGGLLPKKSFTFGLGLHVPLQRLYWWRPQIPEEVHFIFHEDYSQRMLILPAVAYKVTDRLSIGVGVNILFEIDTRIYGPVDIPFNWADLMEGRFEIESGNFSMGSDFTFTLKPALVAGLLLRLPRGLDVGVTYRGELYVDDYGWTDPILRFTFPGLSADSLPGLAFGFGHSFAHFYTPHEIALGLAWRPAGPFLVSLDLTWADWSNFMERERVSNPAPEPRFADTLVPRIGLEHRITERITMRCGYFFYDSPVPEQRGDASDLDNDRHVFSLGSDILFGPFVASWHLQYHLVHTRQYRKVDPDGPYGTGLEFGGSIVSLGIHLSLAI